LTDEPRSAENGSFSMPEANTANLIARYFPGSWNYNAKYLLARPEAERPYFRVEYSHPDELRAAKAVQPPFCQVEYVFVPKPRL
jgi:hypothetical protein